MRMNDNFNIITGEVKPQIGMASTNRRFASLEVLRAIKENRGQQDNAPSFNQRKLGTAQDSKFYQYSYLPSKNQQQRASEIRKKHSQPASLINATKAEFNLINHASSNATMNHNWDLAKKRSPVSKFTDLGRIYAPNYSEAYKQDPIFGKKKSLCNTICEIQRSYGNDKYFRKFK